VELPFRRKSADASLAVEEPEVPSVAGARTRAYTPSKRELGRTTPKRKTGGRVVEAPPANRREALKRSREKQRESRAEARAGMMAGKEEFLMARDKGPERRLVRDIVDSRRNAASYFLPGALIVVFGSSGSMPSYVRLAANMFWVVLALAVIVDSFILTRKVRRLITERFPKSTTRPRSLYWYAIMRSLNFRKLRMPAPQVKIGAPI
jgi:Protein of unknown function (DUF3043)